MTESSCVLSMVNGQLHAHIPEADEPVAVELRYLRPLTDRQHVVVLDTDGKELTMISNMGHLPPACRALAEHVLDQHYRMPVIERVLTIDLRFGTLYWTVDTDRGHQQFALTEPARNVTWLSGNQLVIRDTMGNRFGVHDLSALDVRSHNLISAVL